MSKRNTLQIAPPFEVEAALKRLGANLRTARLARNLSIEAAATKIGVGYRAVATAESGKPGTAAGVYFGLIWAYGLLSQATELADPTRDELVQRAAASRQHAYPTRKGALDNDF
jgi:transcriptional regulator with XRE-family HTH domain